MEDWHVFLGPARVNAIYVFLLHLAAPSVKVKWISKSTNLSGAKWQTPKFYHFCILSSIGSAKIFSEK